MWGTELMNKNIFRLFVGKADCEKNNDRTSADPIFEFKLLL